MPASIVNYVHHSRSLVLLGDTVEHNPYSRDEYFAGRQPRSVLCLPILRQASLTGLLYLENNLFPYTFTPERVRVLELLASQVAISMGSAQLYADLHQENQERRRAEQALLERDRRIHRLVESNIIGIFLWAEKGRITYANDALLRMIGYSQEDALAGRLRGQVRGYEVARF